ncbi:MAG: hypothetical protein AAFX51_04670, partial [Cyanobacteria bacterium J06636_28]
VKQMLCDTGTIYVKTWRGEQTLSISEPVIWLDRNTQEHRRPLTLPRRKQQEPAVAYPYHADLSEEQQPSQLPQAGQITVPSNLRQVIKVDKNRLLVHTVLGPVIIEGQNLTCTLARRVAKAS